MSDSSGKRNMGERERMRESLTSETRLRMAYLLLELKPSTPPRSSLFQLENSAGLRLEHGLQVSAVSFADRMSGVKSWSRSASSKPVKSEPVLEDAKSGRNGRGSEPRAGERGSKEPMGARVEVGVTVSSPGHRKKVSEIMRLIVY